MKISILSDFHFGFGYNSELENDSFENAEEAMQKALDSDLILIAGDIFDSRLPRTETWARAIKVLIKPLLEENREIKLIHSSKELKEISKRTLQHLPVIALHGTHERRGKDEINVVEALENAGLLVHLHCHTVVFEKDGVKVAIHGMSGVPERFAKDILYQWNPKPIEGCFNVLMLHQSIDPFVYSPLEPPSLNLSNLPRGFDLIVDGHLHEAGQKKIDSTTVLFTGSTIVTHLEPKEAEVEKGFYKVDFDNEMKVNFVPLEKSRKFFYRKIELKDFNSVEEIQKEIDYILKENFIKKPIIKFKIFGKEVNFLEQDLRSLERKNSARAVIIFDKELEVSKVAKKIEFLRNLREQKLSVEEIGLKILKKNLEDLNFSSVFDYEQAFNMLSENETDKLFNILTGEQITLEKVLKKSLEKEKVN
ncbi:MAG: DNA repair exonuclease [Candidatus Aenigmatarchaeota archaeon]